MKTKIYKYFLVVGCFVLVLGGCKDDLTPMVNENAPAPGPLSENTIKVENLPGSALLTYDLPEGKEVWYVKAEYEIRPGVARQEKSSEYTNQLLLEGFGESREYKVQLYVVGRNEKESEPVTVRVQPQTPPIKEVYQSLSMSEDFGGLNVTMQNSTKAEIVLFMITPDSLGDWTVAETYYTSQEDGIFYARGFEAEQRPFGVYVRDQYENYSDTLMQELTPLYEEELDKRNFEAVHLPTDTWEQRYSSSPGIPGIWDGDHSTSGYGHNFQSALPSSKPQWFTFDLGVKAKLSRLRYWQKAALFWSGNAKIFELWGSNDPDPDGSWDSWTLLTTFESEKPSGLPGSEITQEDREYATSGEDFTFPLDAPPVRYIRFKTLETHNPSSQNVWVNEISFWGEVQ